MDPNLLEHLVKGQNNENFALLSSIFSGSSSFNLRAALLKSGVSIFTSIWEKFSKARITDDIPRCTICFPALFPL
jgi:hypothetical protein